MKDDKTVQELLEQYGFDNRLDEAAFGVKDVVDVKGLKTQVKTTIKKRYDALVNNDKTTIKELENFVSVINQVKSKLSEIGRLATGDGYGGQVPDYEYEISKLKQKITRKTMTAQKGKTLSGTTDLVKELQALAKAIKSKISRVSSVKVMADEDSVIVKAKGASDADVGSGSRLKKEIEDKVMKMRSTIKVDWSYEYETGDWLEVTFTNQYINKMKLK